MPLTMVEKGKPIVIVRIGGKEETRRFLENLGCSWLLGYGHIRDVRQYDRECKRSTGSHWQRYGKQDHGCLSQYH